MTDTTAPQTKRERERDRFNEAHIRDVKIDLINRIELALKSGLRLRVSRLDLHQLEVSVERKDDPGAFDTFTISLRHKT
jgi:hypothetical protein